MIYFTKPKDTLSSISHYFYGSSDQSHIDLLCYLNETKRFRPYSPILVGTSSHLDIQRKCVRIFKEMTAQNRYVLQALQQHHVKPSIILSLLQLIKTSYQAGTTDLVNTGFASAQILERMTHIRHTHLHHFHHLIEHAYHELHKIADTTSDDIRHAAKQAYAGIRAELTGSFRMEFKRYLGNFEHLFHEDAWESIRLHRLLGWHFSHDIVAKELSIAANFIKHIGHGLFAIDITGVLIEAGIAVTREKNWFDKLCRITVDVESFFASSIIVDATLAMLSLTPVGWAGIICVGGATLLTQHELMKHALNPYLNYINSRY